MKSSSSAAACGKLRAARERGPRPLRPSAGLLLFLAACSGPRPAPTPPPLEPLRELVRIEGALARGADPASFETLLPALLNDRRPLVRRAAARAVARAGHPLAVPWLLERYSREEDPETRAGIVWALGHAADPSAVPLLREASRAEDPRLRAVSAEALASSAGDPEEAGGELARLLHDPVNDVRIAAALAFARHPELPLPETFAALLDPREDERLRWAAVRSFSVRPDLAARNVDLLAESVLDRNPLVSIFALEVLPGISEKGVVPAATLATDPGGWWLPRLAAHRALERWVAQARLSTELEAVVEAALSAETPSPEPRVFPRLLPALEGLGSGSGPDALAALRRRPVVLEVAGKGEMAIELFSRRAAHHTGAVLALARRGAYTDVVPLRADPLTGIEIAPVPGAGGESRPGPGEDVEGGGTGRPPEARLPAAEPGTLPPEPHREPIRRGTLIALPDGTTPGRFLIAALPMPELEGRTTVLGRVVLGARLLDLIEARDRLTLHVPE